MLSLLCCGIALLRSGKRIQQRQQRANRIFLCLALRPRGLRSDA